MKSDASTDWSHRIREITSSAVRIRGFLFTSAREKGLKHFKAKICLLKNRLPLLDDVANEINGELPPPSSYIGFAPLFTLPFFFLCFSIFSTSCLSSVSRDTALESSRDGSLRNERKCRRKKKKSKNMHNT